MRAWSPYGLTESNIMTNADEFADRPLPFVHLLVLTPCCSPFSQINGSRNREDKASVLCNLRAALHALHDTANEAVARRGRECEHPTLTVTIAISCEVGRHTQYSWTTFVYCPRRNGGRLAMRERRIWVGRLIT